MLKNVVLALGMLTMSTAAWAAPLTLTVNGGGWVGGSVVNNDSACVDVDNFGGSAQDEIRWGGGVLTSDPAKINSVDSSLASYVHGGDACWLTYDYTDNGVRYNYDGVAAVSGYNFDPFDGTYQFPGTASPFSLGTFQHLNFDISNAISGVDYELLLGHNDSAAPPANPLAVALSFQHTETPNVPALPCCDDTVTVVVPAAATKLQVGSDVYFFQLLGFSATGQPGTFSSSFSSPEGGTNETRLWAQITPNPVPEPATLTLLGTGLLGLGAVVRRRLRKKLVA